MDIFLSIFKGVSFLLASIVSHQMSAFNGIIIPLYVIHHSSFAISKLCCYWFSTVSLRVLAWVSSCLFCFVFFNHLVYVNFCLSSEWDIFSHFFFKEFFCPFSLLCFSMPIACKLGTWYYPLLNCGSIFLIFYFSLSTLNHFYWFTLQFTYSSLPSPFSCQIYLVNFFIFRNCIFQF